MQSLAHANTYSGINPKLFPNFFLKKLEDDVILVQRPFVSVETMQISNEHLESQHLTLEDSGCHELQISEYLYYCEGGSFCAPRSLHECISMQK